MAVELYTAQGWPFELSSKDLKEEIKGMNCRFTMQTQMEADRLARKFIHLKAHGVKVANVIATDVTFNVNVNKGLMRLAEIRRLTEAGISDKCMVGRAPRRRG